MTLLKNYKVDNINKIPREAIVIGYSDAYFLTIMRTKDNNILWVEHEFHEATYTINEFEEIPPHLFDIYFSVLLTDRLKRGKL